MGIFLLLAVISFLLILLIISVDRTTGSWRAFRWKGWLRVAANPRLVEGIAILGISCIIAIILFFTFWQVASPESSLYEPLDFLTSRRFSQAILGAIFGVLFAIWMTRIYRQSRDPKASLSIAQKVEGAALFALFVVGTTTVPLDDLIRGLKIEAGPIQLELASQKSGAPASETAEPEKAGNLTLSGAGSSGSTYERYEATSAMGYQTIKLLSALMGQDAKYVEDYSTRESFTEESKDKFIEKLKNAAANYDRVFNSLGRCLTEMAEATGDINYVQSNLGRLRPFVRELYTQSLAIRNKSLEGFEPQTLNGLRLVLDDIRLETTRHAQRLSAGTALDQSSANGALARAHATCSKLPAMEPITLDKTAADRPYLAMLYAAFLQLESQELEAIRALRSWRKADQGPQTEAAAGRDGSHPATWFELRLASTEVWLFETWFRRQTSPAQSVLEEYLRSQESYLTLLQGLAAIRKHRSEIFPIYAIADVPGQTVTAFEFTIAPKYREECSYQGGGAYASDLRLNAAYLSAKAVYVRRVLDRTAYSERRHQIAVEYATNLVNLDYTCLYLFFKDKPVPPETVSVLWAENFLTFAMLQLSDLARKQPIGTTYRDWAINKVRLSVGALTLGKAIIEEYHKPNPTPDEAAALSDSLSQSDANRLWEELESRIQAAQKIAQRLEGV